MALKISALMMKARSFRHSGFLDSRAYTFSRRMAFLINKNLAHWHDSHAEDDLVSGPKGISSKTRKGWFTSFDLWSASPFCSPAELTPWPQTMLQIQIQKLSIANSTWTWPGTETLQSRSLHRGRDQRACSCELQKQSHSEAAAPLASELSRFGHRKGPAQPKGHAGRNLWMSTLSRKRLRVQPSEPESANWQEDTWSG